MDDKRRPTEFLDSVDSHIQVASGDFFFALESMPSLLLCLFSQLTYHLCFVNNIENKQSDMYSPLL